MDYSKYTTTKINFGYMPIYEELFKELFNEPINILELGVNKGSSILIWKKMFPKATIFAIDNDPKCSKDIEDERTYVFKGDQKDIGFLGKVVSHPKVRGHGFDIVIDDCSHYPEPQKVSFEFLFPFVKNNGFYVIEDLFFAYRDSFTPQRHKSIVEYLKRKVDDVFCGGKSTFNDSWKRTFPDNLDYWEQHIWSITFVNDLCVIRKKNKIETEYTLPETKGC